MGVTETLNRKRLENMDEDGHNIDYLSNLPDVLIFEVLLNLPTKDVVKTSVLSKKWRKVWRYVPGLDLNYRDVVVIGEGNFPDFTAFAAFVELFLAFNSKSTLDNLKLAYHRGAHSHYLTKWINIALVRKVQHLHVLEGSGWDQYHYHEVKVSSKVYTCESLVSLKLSDVTLSSPKFVFLPSLKDIHLERVKFAYDSNDLPKIDMMRNFLVGISNVKDMVISFDTLKEVTDGYSTCELVPLFCNLSFLCIKFSKFEKLDMKLPFVFLESCMNLKSLVWQGSSEDPMDDSVGLLSVPHCLKSSLEYVKIDTSSLQEATEMKLVGYFLENSAILKKLTICLDKSRKWEASVIVKKLRTVPRLSTSCQVMII